MPVTLSSLIAFGLLPMAEIAYLANSPSTPIKSNQKFNISGALTTFSFHPVFILNKPVETPLIISNSIYPLELPNFPIASGLYNYLQKPYISV